MKLKLKKKLSSIISSFKKKKPNSFAFLFHMNRMRRMLGEQKTDEVHAFETQFYHLFGKRHRSMRVLTGAPGQRFRNLEMIETYHANARRLRRQRQLTGSNTGSNGELLPQNKKNSKRELMYPASTMYPSYNLWFHNFYFALDLCVSIAYLFFVQEIQEECLCFSHR